MATNAYTMSGKGVDVVESARVASEAYREWARIFRALGNESRLLIVARLGNGECSVGELTRLVGLDQSTVSKHLSVLRAHGIVGDRRQGNVVFYRLLTPCVLSFFTCAGNVLKERLELAMSSVATKNPPAGD